MVGGVVVARRAQLVEAAFALVAQVGFEGLRLRQVAGSVAIDHSTIHHHFATKQELVEAVAEFTTRQFHQAAPSGSTPHERLRTHLGALQRLMRDWPELLTVSAELDLRTRRDPAVRVAMETYESGWRTALVDVFERGAWAVDLSPAAAAELVIAVVKGVRLAPETAGEAFAALEALLIGDTETR